MCPREGGCVYAQVFEAASPERGPSGLRERPRPFVFRAAHLDGRTIKAGERFAVEVNLFDTRNPPVKWFQRAMTEMGKRGFGGGRAELESSEQRRVSISLAAGGPEVRRLRVEFITPTELKGENGRVTRPEFKVLFARARDRVSTLRALYGAGPLEIDFRAMGERAAAVRMTRSDLRHVEARRRSSRTGQVHGIGGLVGTAEYEGELSEFLPYLEAAGWTGVGRQCVWGKGEVHVEGK